MKTTIKFFAIFLSFIFLSNIIQAQSQKNWRVVKKSSPVKRSTQKNYTIKQRNAAEFARRAKMQKMKARQNALSKGKKAANKRVVDHRNTSDYSRRAEMQKRKARLDALNKRRQAARNRAIQQRNAAELARRAKMKKNKKYKKNQECGTGEFEW